MKKSLSKRVLLTAVILMDLLVGMEFDLFVPSFPQLQAEFNLSPFWVEALLSVNFLGYCVSMFFVGGLADRYGRKPIILFGLSGFIVGSIFCLGSSYLYLFVGRFLQGLGIAAPAILSFLIIADSYPLKKQQFLMAILNGVMNISVAAAPILGSYITLYFHWQGNFVALLVLSVVVLLMSVLCVPSHAAQNKEIHWFKGYGQIFKSGPLMLLIIHIVFMCVPYWIFVGISPVLYMKDLGVSLTHFGLYQGVLALIFGLGSLLFGLLLHLFNQRKMLSISNFLFFLSLISIGWVSLMDDMHPLAITLALLPLIIGQIIPCTILFPVCLNYFPHAKGRVSAIIQGAKLLFTSFSLQLAGYFYHGTFQSTGLIISGFIVMVVITLFLVLRTPSLKFH